MWVQGLFAIRYRGCLQYGKETGVVCNREGNKVQRLFAIREGNKPLGRPRNIKQRHDDDDNNNNNNINKNNLQLKEIEWENVDWIHLVKCRDKANCC
jgi:hypothetical protein